MSDIAAPPKPEQIAPAEKSSPAPVPAIQPPTAEDWRKVFKPASGNEPKSGVLDFGNFDKLYGSVASAEHAIVSGTSAALNSVLQGLSKGTSAIKDTGKEILNGASSAATTLEQGIVKGTSSATAVAESVASGVSDFVKQAINDPANHGIDPINVVDAIAGTHISTAVGAIVKGMVDEAVNHPVEMAEYGLAGAGFIALTAFTGGTDLLVAGAITAAGGAELLKNSGHGVSGEVTGVVDDVTSAAKDVGAAANDFSTVAKSDQSNQAAIAASQARLEDLGAKIAPFAIAAVTSSSFPC
jgi:hypothetical protein